MFPLRTTAVRPVTASSTANLSCFGFMMAMGLPVRRASQAADLVVHALEQPQLLARLDIPDADGLIPTARDQLPAISGKHYSPNLIRMTGKLLHFFAGGSIPHASRVVIGTGSNSPTITREGDGPIIA